MSRNRAFTLPRVLFVAADFGRFDESSNAWYKEHKAGASFTPGGVMPPAFRPTPPEVATPAPAPAKAAADESPAPAKTAQ